MDSFHFECMGCVKMKGLEVEIEQLRQLVALMGREEVGCASDSSGGTVGKVEKVMKKMLGKLTSAWEE